MVSKDPKQFTEDLVLLMAERLRVAVRPLIKSETLRDSIEIQLLVDGGMIGAALAWPHYWAVYYHDGRGPLRPVNGRFLVYFVDPEDDPRFKNGYPIRAQDIKRLELSPEEFKAAIASGKMIVANYIGPARGKRFIDRLARRAPKLVQGIVKREFRGHVRAALDDVLKLRITSKLR